jgi:carboxymethylenebutenolidase
MLGTAPESALRRALCRVTMASMGEMIEFDGVHGYLAAPEGQPKGALVVIHEIWGLVEHITDVADRFAAEGYLVLAPDILSMAGIDPVFGQELHRMMQSPDEATRLEAQPRLRDALSPIRQPEYAGNAVTALRSAVDYLEAQPGLAGSVAVTGFCFGGTFTFALAAADPRVRAAIPFYGTAPDADAIATIGCPVLAIYGSVDESLMTALPQVTEQMSAAGVAFTPKVYEGAQHAFFNNTGANFDAAAAADAWDRSLAFLDATLR